MADKPRLLAIDDDPEVCEFLEDAVGSLGFEVRSVSDPHEVDDVYRAFQPTAIVLDLVMPERDGIQILRFLATEGCEAPIALISGHDQPMVRRAISLGEALGLNLTEPLRKPIQLADLRSVLKKIT
ncbi:MAG: response regulator [Proteobacteria bacterium]|nr:response regulator [Pseudomonadota bacterium]